jgi:hypothetical protein
MAGDGFLADDRPFVFVVALAFFKAWEAGVIQAIEVAELPEN